MTTTPTASPELPVLDLPATTDAAREYLVAWHRENLTAAPYFTDYISKTLAGDFAYHLARWLARRAQPEGEAPQAEVSDEMIDAACAAVPDLYRVDAMRAIEAALSVRPAAQHAESDVQAAVKRALELYADSYDSMSRMRDGKVSAEDVDYDIRCNMVSSVLKVLAAQSQGAQAPSRDDVLEEAARHFEQDVFDPAKVAMVISEIRALKGRAAKAEAPAHPVARVQREPGASEFKLVWLLPPGPDGTLLYAGPAAQQAAAPGALDADTAEGIELLETLIDNIATDGNYSAEATLTFLSQIRQCFAAPSAPGTPCADDIAVDRFAAAMREKMAKSRAKGRDGWDDPALCSAESLNSMLVEHLGKGDPMDIATFAMMLWNRGERTSAPGTPEAPADDAKDAARYRWLRDEAQNFYETGDGVQLVAPDTKNWFDDEDSSQGWAAIDAAVDLQMATQRAAQLDGGQGEGAGHVD